MSNGLKMLVMSLAALALAECGHATVTSDEEAPTPLGLATDLDTLTASHQDMSVGAVIRVPFDRPLADALLDPSGETAASGESLAQLGNLVRVFVDADLSQVAGRLYLSSTRDQITFVPSGLLAPSSAFVVVITQGLPAADGSTLPSDIRFTATTRADTEVVVIGTAPTPCLEGSDITFTAGSDVELHTFAWVFGDDSNAPTASVASPTQTFAEAGVYPISVDVGDAYGRHFSKRAEVSVSPNLAARLATVDNVSNIETIDPSAIADPVLVAAINADPEPLLQAVSATVSAAGASGTEIYPLVAFNGSAAKHLRVKAAYAAGLLGADSLIGVVNYRGMPTVVGHGVDNQGASHLRMLMDNGDTQIHLTGGSVTVDVSLAGTSPTPTAYFMEVPASESIITSLEALVTSPITNSLQTLTIDPDGALFVSDPEGPVFPYPPPTRGIGSFVGYVVSTVQQVLSTLSSLLSGDAINLLKGVKGFVTTVINQNPFDQVSGMKADLADIKDDVVLLYTTFKDGGGIIGSATDPERVITETRRFLYEDASSNVKDVARGVFNALNYVGQASQTNPFKKVSDILLSHSGDTGSFITSFLSGLDSTKSAHMILWLSATPSVSLKYGSTTQSFSLALLNDIKAASDVVSQLGDLPLSTLVDKLTTLSQSSQGMVGIYYDAPTGKITLTISLTLNSAEIYRLDVYAAASGSGFVCKITNPLYSDNTLTITYDPIEPPDPDDPMAHQVVQVLASSANPFPNLSLTLETKFRSINATFTGRLRPELAYGVSLKGGIDIDYAVVVGGKVTAGISLDFGISQAGAVELLADTAAAAYETVSNNMGALMQTDTTTHTMKLPDEETLILFLKDFAASLRDNMSLSEYELQAGIGASLQVGVGVGVGGTGTGGAQADVTFGVGVGLSTDLSVMADFLAFYRNHGATSLYFKEVMQLLAQAAASGSPTSLDVKSVVRAFRQGFVDLIVNTPPSDLEPLLHSFAENFSMAVSFQTGVSGEAEEVGSAEVGIAYGASISVNGEFIMNAMLVEMMLMLEQQGFVDSDLYERLKLLDQPGVFPEISFALPITGTIGVSVDEGVKIGVEGSVSATFLDGSISLQGDPYRTTQGAVAGTKTLATYPVVMVTASPGTANANQTVVFDAHTITEPGTSIASYAWQVDGAAAGTGATLSRSFTQNGQHMVAVKITDSSSRTAVAELTFAVGLNNGAPTAPGIGLSAGTVFVSTGSFSVTPATDPNGDSLTYEIQVASDNEFKSLVSQGVSFNPATMTVTLQNLPYGDFFVRARASDGVAYSAWSATVSFGMAPAACTQLEPADQSQFASNVPIVVRCTDARAASYQFQLAASSAFASVLKTQNGASSSWTVSPLGFGSFFWRVRVTGGGHTGDWSVPRQLRLLNSAPGKVTVTTPLAPEYTTDKIVPIRLTSTDADGDALLYTVTITDLTGSVLYTSSATSTQFNVSAHDLGEGERVLWNAVAHDASGVSPDWLTSDHVYFMVLNTPPYAPVLKAPTDGKMMMNLPASLTLEVQPAVDFDGDAIDHYEFEVGYPDGVRVLTSLGPSITLTDLPNKRAGYSWTVRAIATTGSAQGTKTKAFRFVLFLLHPPVAVPTAPRDGEVIILGGSTTFAGTGTDVDGDAIQQYVFEWSYDPAMKSIWGSYGGTSSQWVVGVQGEGTYYWRLQVRDATFQDSPFSDLSCYTVLGHLNQPTGSADAEYELDNKKAPVKLWVSGASATCRGESFGVFQYEIYNDVALTRLVDSGTFTPGASFQMSAVTKRYYARVRHLHGAFVSPWSTTPLSFLVVDKLPDTPPDPDGDINLEPGSANERDGVIHFDVKLKQPKDHVVTVVYLTEDGTAAAGTDYVETNGVLTFNVGEVLKTISVQLINDTIQETDEYFAMRLGNPQGATLGADLKSGAIEDDDGPPLMRVHEAVVTEGPAAVASVHITLNNAASSTVTATYTAIDGTALVGGDYVATTGTVTFGYGQAEQAVDIPITNDNVVEDTEVFFVVLTNAAGAIIATGSASVTITDDDVPHLTLGDIALAENGGTATFTAFLDSAPVAPVSVSYATSDGSALSGVDYTAASGTLNFAIGQTLGVINVSLIDDALFEGDETFTMTLSSPVRVILDKASATCTIEDNEVAPTIPQNGLTLSTSYINEPPGAPTATTVTATLTSAATQAVSVTLGFSGTGAQGSNYTVSSSTISIPFGQQSGSIVVTARCDGVAYTNKTIIVSVASVSGATSVADPKTITLGDPHMSPGCP